MNLIHNGVHNKKYKICNHNRHNRKTQKQNKKEHNREIPDGI